MITYRIKMNGFALLTICSLGVLLPTESFATLNEIACRALKSTCDKNCSVYGKQDCFNQCELDWIDCIGAADVKKQQTPPPPCTGVRCSLPVHNPPTIVSDPTHPPRRPIKPIKPVKPVRVSNPGNPNAGKSDPVILLRKNNSGGQGHGH